MPKKIAIVYASHDGHTQKISERIVQQLTNRELDAVLISITEFEASQFSTYDFVVLGSSIRYGKHLPEMVKFITKNQAVLSNETTAFFSVNLTARKENRNTPETSNYIKKMFAQLTWQPELVEVFAGKVNFPIYRFFDKCMIRFIMWLTKGPTDVNAVVDFTNWEQVDQFAQRVSSLNNQ